RRALLGQLHRTAWKSFSLLNAQIPGMLLQRPLESLSLFAPYHGCPLPVSKEQLGPVSVEELDRALEAAQLAVASYLEGHAGEIGRSELTDNSGSPFLERLEVDGSFCVPQTGYSPLPAVDGAPWSFQDEKKRDLHLIASASGTEPFLISLARRAENTPVSNGEVRLLMAWVGALRGFRNSLAEFEAFRTNQKSFNRPPAMKVSAALGEKLSQTQGDKLDAVSSLELKKNEQGLVDRAHVNSPALVAERIYRASARRRDLPDFKACENGQWCFVDGQRTDIEKLDEKVTIALQDRDLKPGAYLQALALLGQRTSMLQVAAIDTLLPEALRTTQLPGDACREQVQNTSGDFFTGATALYEKILTKQQGSEERSRWVQQIAKGITELVYSLQMRETTLRVPPATAQDFDYKGQRLNLYSAAQKLALSWADSFFSENTSKLPDWGTKAGTWGPFQTLITGHWAQLDRGIHQQLGQDSFEKALQVMSGRSFELGQVVRTDFMTILGEKLLVLFGSIGPEWEESLVGEIWNDRQLVLKELILRAVVSAMRETLAAWVVDHAAPDLFVAKTTAGGIVRLVPVMPEPELIAENLWATAFDPQWAELLRQHPQDLNKITDQVVQALYATESVKETLKPAQTTNALARKEVLENVRQMAPVAEAAARAQETAEYMASLASWHANPLYRLPFGKSWNFHDAASGTFPGTASACFYMPKNGYERHGLNPFGILNPLEPADYEHLRRAFISILGRKHEALENKIKSHYTQINVHQATGLREAKDFAGEILSKFGSVSLADDTQDTGRVSAIRHEAFEDLKNWFRKNRQAPEFYKKKMEAAFRKSFDAEILPLIRLRPTSKDGQKAWDAYFAGRVSRFFEGHFPSSKPIAAAEILESFAKAGSEDQTKTTAANDAVKKVVQTIEEQGFYKVATDVGFKKFQEYCAANAQECQGWLETAKTVLSDSGLRKVFEARASAGLVLQFKNQIKKKLKTENLTAQDHGILIKTGWSAFDLYTTWGAKLAALDKAGKSTDALKKLAAQIEALKAKEADRKKADIASLAAYFAKQPFTHEEIEKVQKATQDFLAENDGTFEAWRKHLLSVVDVALQLQPEKDAAAQAELFMTLQMVWHNELASVIGRGPRPSPQVLAAVTEALQLKADFYTVLAEQSLPGFYDFRHEVLDIVADLSVPQPQLDKEIEQTEKALRAASDILDTLDRKGEKDSKDYRKIEKERERYNDKMAKARG
ncbi:hypothetical protein K2X33_16775, partial [bacterium]|nr:hypothetical protein [bacterium]